MPNYKSIHRNYCILYKSISIAIIFLFICQSSISQTKNYTTNGDNNQTLDEHIYMSKKKMEAKTRSKEYKWKKINKYFWKSKYGDIAFKVYHKEFNDSVEVYINKMNDPNIFPNENVNLLNIIDTSTFKMVNNKFYLDKNNVYYLITSNDGEGEFYIFKGADPSSFVIINSCYYKDNRKIYGDDLFFDDIDYSTFKTNNNSYCIGIDKNNIFVRGRIVTIEDLQALENKEKSLEMLKIVEELKKSH